MDIIIITQARIGSSRLDKKVLLQLGSKTVLETHLNTLKQSKLKDKIIVATTFEPGVEEIIEICSKVNVEYFQGSLNDVLKRFYFAAIKHKPKYVVRVTSDCPLIDPTLIDEMIKNAKEYNVDYYTNTFTETFPDGQDIEVIKWEALEFAQKNAKLSSEREHVTPLIRTNCSLNNKELFKGAELLSHENLGHIRMTLDQKEDLDTLRYVIDKKGENKSWVEYANFIHNSGDIITNANIKRNEGYIKSLNNEQNYNG